MLGNVADAFSTSPHRSHPGFSQHVGKWELFFPCSKGYVKSINTPVYNNLAPTLVAFQKSVKVCLRGLALGTKRSMLLLLMDF